jgi:hypothetical protein
VATAERVLPDLNTLDSDRLKALIIDLVVFKITKQLTPDSYHMDGLMRHSR